MKIKYLLSVVGLTLMAVIASAGQVVSVPVEVDLTNMFASGDQNTARIARDDVSFIGCGTRDFDDGINSFSFGFCQAADSNDVGIVCFTQNPILMDAIKAHSAFAFITFSWQDDGAGGAECTRVGSSTQSFYLPNFTRKGSN